MSSNSLILAVNIFVQGKSARNRADLRRRGRFLLPSSDFQVQLDFAGAVASAPCPHSAT